MFESTLLVAAELPVQVSVEDPAWLGATPLEDSSAAPVALLTVRRHVNLTAPTRVDLFGAHWAKVHWSHADRADFSVRGGVGQLRIIGDTLECDLALAPALADDADSPRAIRFAVASALRLILSLLLPVRGAFLVHCSSVVVEGRAALFLGHSGAGKTTTARRLGREGALRIADDTAVLWLQPQPQLEPCRFDRAARLPGRAGAWPVARGYQLKKGADRVGVGAASETQLALWSSALFVPRVGAALAPRFLDNLASLARYLPVRTFAAPPAGPLLPALRQDLGLAGHEGIS